MLRCWGGRLPLRLPLRLFGTTVAVRCVLSGGIEGGVGDGAPGGTAGVYTSRMGFAVREKRYGDAEAIIAEVKSLGLKPGYDYYDLWFLLPSCAEAYAEFRERKVFIPSSVKEDRLLERLFNICERYQQYAMVPELLRHAEELDYPDFLYFDLQVPVIIASGAQEGQMKDYCWSLAEEGNLTAEQAIRMLARMIVHNPSALSSTSQILQIGGSRNGIELGEFLNYTLHRCRSGPEVESALLVAAQIISSFQCPQRVAESAFQECYESLLRRGLKFVAHQLHFQLEQIGINLNAPPAGELVDLEMSKVVSKEDLLRLHLESGNYEEIGKCLPSFKDKKRNTVDFFMEIVPESCDSLTLLNGLKEAQVRLPVPLIKALMKRDPWETVLQLVPFLEEIPRGVDAEAFEFLMRKCASEGKLASLPQLAEDALSLGLLNNTTRDLVVDSLYQSDRFPDVLNFVKLMQNATESGQDRAESFTLDAEFLDSLFHRLNGQNTLSLMETLSDPPVHQFERLVNLFHIAPALDLQTASRMTALLRKAPKGSETGPLPYSSGKVAQILSRVEQGTVLLKEGPMGAKDLRYYNSLLASHIANHQYEAAKAILEEISNDSSLKPDYFTRKHQKVVETALMGARPPSSDSKNQKADERGSKRTSSNPSNRKHQKVAEEAPKKSIPNLKHQNPIESG